MKERLFKTRLAEYEKAEWKGINTSGWEAIGNKVIIQPDECSAESKGGVALPDDLVDRMSMAAEAGVVIAVGEGCFKYNSDGTLFAGRSPVPGDRVSIGRYSGQLLQGHDNKSYRIMDDSQVGAIEVQ